VITTKESIEPGEFCALCDSKKLGVASALLGFGEYTKLHEMNLTGMYPVIVGNAKLLR
jgi:hypothetical protein